MSDTQSRTRWAERQSEELLSVPFIAEFVLRSPQMIDGTQKEVADILILYKDRNLLISQKAQEDPLSRSEQKNELWALKAAKNGVSQLRGALRHSTNAIWCEHPRRGRFDLPAGLPPIAHGIVTVETFRPVNLQSEVADLPLIQGSTPITYFSLNDFLNVALQLRTVPELIRYLNARRDLPEETLRKIGDEQTLFEFYLLGGTFKQCNGHDHARRVVKEKSNQVDEVLVRMVEYRRYSSIMERVGYELATRSSTCLDGLSPELLAKFDPPENRSIYLLMQEVIADLPLVERAALGRKFDEVIQSTRAQLQGYTQATAYSDARPEWIFVFGSSKGWARSGILNSLERIMCAALTHYEKQRCMIIIDRDGRGFEVAINRPEESFTPTDADIANGNKLFGNLRMRDEIVNGF